MIKIIEKNFWGFLIAGVLAGLFIHVNSENFMVLLKPSLMVMLFLVFLKADVLQVIKRIKNYKQALFLVIMYMFIVPILFYEVISLINQEFAIAVLLLASMPAGAAASVLTDIVDGNTELAASITIITSMVAPFSVVALFEILNIKILEIDSVGMFTDLAMFIFVPMVLSQVVKRFFSDKVEKTKHIFASFNVIILTITIFFIMGAQREMILDTSIIVILTNLGYLYVVFILFHIVGYYLGFNEDKKGKIATAVGGTYMNNGMAIILAAIYFTPYILLVAVLAEIPWNTLLGPFKKIINMNNPKLIPIRVISFGRKLGEKR